METEWTSADRLGRWAESRRLLVIDRIGYSDLVPSTYSRARVLSHWPDRIVSNSLVSSTDGIGTMSPKTDALAIAKKNYALCAELGQRAYDSLTCKVAIQPKPKRSSRKAEAKAKVLDQMQAVRERRTSGVVVLGSELATALGIKPIGYLE